MFKSNYKGYGSGVMSAIAWGLDTVLVGVILSMAPFINTEVAIVLAPFVSTFLHDLFSTLWMFLYMVCTRQVGKLFKALKTPSTKYVVLASILGGPIGMTGYLLSVKYIGPSYAATISSIYPAVGAVLAAIFLKERISKKGYVGLIISILGIALLGFSNNGGEANIIGFLFAGLSVLGWGAESVICSYGMKDEEINPKQALQIRQFISAVCSGLIILPLLKAYPLVFQALKGNILWVIIITALMGTISYVCYYTAIHKLGPTRAMGLNITYVVWAMVFDKFLLGHDITIKMVICALMVMIGSFVVATQPAHEEELTNVTNSVA
ncbi:EamA family transporter [Clostridium perfringens]|nr:EamA family transporter [Clostridium perfringens]